MRFQSGTSIHEGKPHVESCCDQVALFFPHVKEFVLRYQEGRHFYFTFWWVNEYSKPRDHEVREHIPLTWASSNDNRFREMTKRGALLHGVPYGLPKMEYP